jgi:hypothetical protein
MAWATSRPQRCAHRFLAPSPAGHRFDETNHQVVVAVPADSRRGEMRRRPADVRDVCDATP